MFDAAITDLKWLVSIGQRARTADVAEIHQAIRALEEYATWKPLIEKAKGVAEDTERCLKFLERVNEDEEARSQSGRKIFPLAQIRDLIESIPKQEK